MAEHSTDLVEVKGREDVSARIARALGTRNRRYTPPCGARRRRSRHGAALAGTLKRFVNGSTEQREAPPAPLPPIPEPVGPRRGRAAGRFERSILRRIGLERGVDIGGLQGRWTKESRERHVLAGAAVSCIGSGADRDERKNRGPIGPRFVVMRRGGHTRQSLTRGGHKSPATGSAIGRDQQRWEQRRALHQHTSGKRQPGSEARRMPDGTGAVWAASSRSRAERAGFGNRIVPTVRSA